MFERILDIMKLNDEEEDDDLYDEEEFEEERPVRRKQRYSDDSSDDERPRSSARRSVPQENVQRQQPKPRPKKVVPVKRSASGLELRVIRPSSMLDGSEITATLLEGKPVILNFEGVQHELAQKIIDYTSGSCCAIYGSIQKVNNFIFIATPKDVDLSGDISDLFDDDSKSSRYDDSDY